MMDELTDARAPNWAGCNDCEWSGLESELNGTCPECGGEDFTWVREWGNPFADEEPSE